MLNLPKTLYSIGGCKRNWAFLNKEGIDEVSFDDNELVKIPWVVCDCTSYRLELGANKTSQVVVPKYAKVQGLS